MLKTITLTGLLQVTATVQVEVPEGGSELEAAMELPRRPWVDADGNPVQGEISDIEVDED